MQKPSVSTLSPVNTTRSGLSSLNAIEYFLIAWPKFIDQFFLFSSGDWNLIFLVIFILFF